MIKFLIFIIHVAHKNLSFKFKRLSITSWDVKKKTRDNNVDTIDVSVVSDVK